MSQHKSAIQRYWCVQCESDSCPHLKSPPASSMGITPEIIRKAKRIIGSSPAKAAGYRLKVFLIEAEDGLEAGQAQQFPTLAAAGLQTKSANQKSRETRGTDMAIVVDIGPVAFTGDITGNIPWVKVGQCIRMQRYNGHRFEEPPGSGRWFGFVNDEDILGYYEESVNG